MSLHTKKVLLFFIIISSSCFQTNAQDLISFNSSLFAGSGDCITCHTSGIGTFKTSEGEDIAPPTTWRSTMMANSARDPLWRAKVQAEATEFPALRSAIEDKCTTCHAPMGKTQHLADGGVEYSFEILDGDQKGKDGVSCTLCHQIDTNGLGEEESFSGHFIIQNYRKIFGPYMTPLTNQMINNVGYTPTYSSHIEQSELCAVCHTLFTSYIDINGQPAGRFPEQTPYLEWKNSVYPSQNKSCQFCHMPNTEEEMRISILPPWLETKRSPVWEHGFVGGNTLLPTIFKSNAQILGTTSSSSHFESTIVKASDMLDNAIDLSTEMDFSAELLSLDVTVTNKSGHKFPTGFPSRRAWLRITVTNDDDAVLFDSGKWDEDNNLITSGNPYQRHRDNITQDDEVQIYETIMADEFGVPTTTLLKAARYIKDNRIPPQGFVSTILNFEDIAIHGDASEDSNFNSDNGREGTGSDRVHYKINIPENSGDLTVETGIYYTSLSKAFEDDIFSNDHEDIIKFKGMYFASPREPFLITKTVSMISTTSVLDKSDGMPESFILQQNIPNPFNSSTSISFNVLELDEYCLTIYNTSGQRVKTLIEEKLLPGSYNVNWSGMCNSGEIVPSGLYLYELRNSHSITSKKMMFLE